MFYQGLDTIEVLDPRTTRVVRGSARSGPAPRMMPGGSLADELNAATECLNGWLAEDDGPDPKTSPFWCGTSSNANGWWPA